MKPYKQASIVIHVPEGAGSNGYQIILCGDRIQILKALCHIYGGDLESYDWREWYDSSEQTVKTEETV